jgi:hypothetical protein
MAREKKHKKKDDATAKIEKTVDPYTGEEEPVAEDADQFIEVMPEETDDRRGSNYLLNEESSMDSYTADAGADAISEQSAHYTDDEDIKADFAARQNLAIGGRDELRDELDEHHSLSPEITGGDIDASWQTANVAGEETVGGSVSTPDQDIVDNLGAAAGLTYKDDEPLDYDQKVLDRDRNRWELNPASALNEEDEELDDEDLEEDEDLEDDLVGEDLDGEGLEEDELEEDDLDELEDDDELIDAEIEDEDV